MEALKAAVFSPPWAVIWITTWKALVGEPSTVKLPPPSPSCTTGARVPAVVAATGRQKMRAAPPWTASMVASASGDRPSRPLILAASMSPVMMIGVSDTTGEAPILTLSPSPVAVAKPSRPSEMIVLTSLSIAS